MSMTSLHLFGLSQLLLVLLNFILQMIALCTTGWASFTARTDLGKPKEHGHYGLWSLCSTKGPHWVEDCDPLDTFFELPPYSKVSLIAAVFHLLFLLSFLPLGFIRSVQIIKNELNLAVKTKHLCIAKATIAMASTISAILVSIFISVEENRWTEYLVQKGSSFWIQICIIFVDITIVFFCLLEGVRLRRQYLQQQIDPEGKRAETYGNPSFDPDSPELTRHRRPSSEAIAYTESSGHPYDFDPQPGCSNYNGKKGAKSGKKVAENLFETLTYENECYQESSPNSGRRHRP